MFIYSGVFFKEKNYKYNYKNKATEVRALRMSLCKWGSPAEASLASSKYAPGARLHAEGNWMFARCWWVVECPAFFFPFVWGGSSRPLLLFKTLPSSLTLEDIIQFLLRKPFHSASFLLYHMAPSPLLDTEYASYACNRQRSTPFVQGNIFSNPQQSLTSESLWIRRDL